MIIDQKDEPEQTLYLGAISQKTHDWNYNKSQYIYF